MTGVPAPTASAAIPPEFETVCTTVNSTPVCAVCGGLAEAESAAGGPCQTLKTPSTEPRP